MTKQFQKNVEDFTCEHCSVFVKGNGFTNHCPECLWSKHVDRNPGDRQELCRGLMKPIAVFGSPASEIEHVCERCGFKKKNKTAREDNFERLLEIAKQRAES